MGVWEGGGRSPCVSGDGVPAAYPNPYGGDPFILTTPESVSSSRGFRLIAYDLHCYDYQCVAAGAGEPDCGGSAAAGGEG